MSSINPVPAELQTLIDTHHERLWEEVMAENPDDLLVVQSDIDHLAHLFFDVLIDYCIVEADPIITKRHWRYLTGRQIRMHVSPETVEELDTKIADLIQNHKTPRQGFINAQTSDPIAWQTHHAARQQADK